MAMEGSPPLTRGIHSYMAGICYRVRFTPAHAGNTCVHNRTIGRRWVHPRSRREYTRSLTRADLAEGSPPLTRGILSGNVRLTTSLRFTPAHAGNTSRMMRSNISLQVHPRSRGEYYMSAPHQRTQLGSPPLTRGILCADLGTEMPLWFTPAHAGNTFPLLCSHSESYGSPPLTRGIH